VEMGLVVGKGVREDEGVRVDEVEVEVEDEGDGMGRWWGTMGTDLISYDLWGFYFGT